MLIRQPSGATERAPFEAVMQRLCAGVSGVGLPAPLTIDTVGGIATVYVANLTDLHTWAAWLGCRGPLDVRVLNSRRRIVRFTTTDTRWRGWHLQVRLYEEIPADRVAATS